MRIMTPTLAAFAVMFATPALADDPKQEDKDLTEKDDTATKAGATNETGKKGKNKAQASEKICRRVRLTGSRRLKRVCMTKEQWQKQNNGN